MLEFVNYIIIVVFAYCTDFVINLSNILGVSYYEVNAFIFVILWPVLTIVLFIVFIIQIIRLSIIRKKV